VSGLPSTKAILWSLNKVAHQVPIIDIHFIPFVNFMFFVNIPGQSSVPGFATPSNSSVAQQGGPSDTNY
jgi:hypothetical protein